MSDEPEYPSQPWETPKPSPETPQPQATPQPQPQPTPSGRQTFDPDRDTVDWSRTPKSRRNRRGLNKQQVFWLSVVAVILVVAVTVGVIAAAVSGSNEKKASTSATTTATAPATAAPAPPPATWPPAQEETAWQGFLAAAPQHGHEVDRRCFLNTLESRWPDLLAFSNAPQADRDAVVLVLLTRCTASLSGR
jgi:hypothetical protein